jgi:beta-N-acetylhexosaminidase
MLGLGLNCNLAPVLDLAAEGHMHRQERSFGDDPAHTAKIAGAFAQGLSLEGVMAFGKHYPGYGSSSENSDHAYVVDDRSSQEFTRQESAFALVGEGLSGVMMTNIGYRAYGEVPAAFSPELVAMAHERGWLTITDDLAIPALAELAGGDPLEVVRQAFLAGNDLLLTTWPLSAEGAPDYVGVLAALVRDQPELQARVDQSVLRILRVKSELGLLP